MVRIIRNTRRCTPLLALAVAVSLASPALSDGGSRPGPLGPLEIAKLEFLQEEGKQGGCGGLR